MQFSLNFSLLDGNQKLSLFHSQAEKVGSYLFEIFVVVVVIVLSSFFIFQVLVSFLLLPLIVPVQMNE